MKRSNRTDSQAYNDYLKYDYLKYDYLKYDSVEDATESQEWETSTNYSEKDQERYFPEEYSDREDTVWEDEPESTDETFYNNTGQYRSRQEYQRQLEETSSTQQFDFQEDEGLPPSDLADMEVEEGNPKLKRAKYSAKVDRFLTNGIIVVAVLLIAVLLIAFLV